MTEQQIYSLPTDSASAKLLEDVISGELHDRWFSVEDLLREGGKTVVEIPLLEPNKSPSRVVFELRGVERIDITDTERIDQYNIHSVAIDLERKCITIRGNIPVKVECYYSPGATIGIIAR